ncbi:MAG: nucleotide exchange factor GrpE [Verrucomicrobia bacterium]|nr:nucleotide exchange factor GrpE [Verrucomicrobiota bacterium]MDE3098439.1 nucleotide exchange factor GrpE [Verrucomicrobiota bacterium]
MNNPERPAISKWPFLLAQILLLGFAWLFVWRSAHPIPGWEIAVCFAIAVAGAAIGVWPYLLDYHLIGRVIERQALGDVAGKIQNLEKLAAQISSATNLWSGVQGHAERTANAANEIAERMSNEVRQFADFMQKMNDGEKAALRLETEKLRRGESEFLQVLVRILDHVFLLESAAARSGQPKLAEQISNFQTACREAARRVGLMPFAAAVDEPFDGKRHQCLAGAAAADGAVVAETIGAGYTFQGRLLRPALVKLRGAAPDGGNATPEAGVEETADAESEKENRD